MWLAEVGIFADGGPALARSVLLDAIDRRIPITQVAREQVVSATTVRIELHPHGLFEKYRLRHRRDG